MKFEYPFFSGSLRVVYSEKGVTEIRFQMKKTSDRKKWDPVAREIIRKLDCYLKEGSQSLGITVDWKNLDGTTFQKRVWRKISQIPHGQVKTYGELARSVKKPKAFRAVGTACGKNPVLLAIPCHRVIGVGGLGGFSGGGLTLKRKLHILEKIYL